MKKININQLIDSRNQQFMDIILQNNISIAVYRPKPFGLPYWTVNYNCANSTAKIFAGKKMDLNAFTHELLHIIEEINGQHSHQTLSTLVGTTSSSFTSILTDHHIAHINNVILHERMLPEYLSAGFPKNRFVFDYYKKPRFRQLTKSHFKLANNNLIDIANLKCFLSLFFSYRFHPNKFVKEWYRKKVIKKYLTFHPDLLNDLENLCNNWTNQIIFSSSSFLINLLNLLDTWKTRNNYI